MAEGNGGAGGEWGAQGYDPEKDRADIAKERAEAALTPDERERLAQQAREETEPTAEEVGQEIEPAAEEVWGEVYNPPDADAER